MRAPSAAAYAPPALLVGSPLPPAASPGQTGPALLVGGPLPPAASPRQCANPELASAQKRIEELEQDRVRQKFEIRRLRSTLHKVGIQEPDQESDQEAEEDRPETQASASSAAAHAKACGGAPSSSTKSGGESTWSQEPSSLLTPRSLSSELARQVHGSSIPSTPEFPMRELPPELSTAAVCFFGQHLRGSAAGRPSAEPVEAPSYSQAGSFGHSTLYEPPLWLRVASPSGLLVRAAPDAAAPYTGAALVWNEAFAVSEAVPGVDRRLYLRLADGRGWIPDNSPGEGSAVVRGHWAPTFAGQHPASSVMALAPSFAVPVAMGPAAPFPAAAAVYAAPVAAHPGDAAAWARHAYQGFGAQQGRPAQGADAVDGHEARRWMRGKRGGVKKHRPRPQQAG